MGNFNRINKTPSFGNSPVGGFSLIELLVVCALVALIMAFLFPAYRSTIRRTDQFRCLSNLRQIHSALLLFYSDQHYFPIGYSDDTQPPPGSRWSRIRRHFGVAGHYTQWQIEIAPYLGNGTVEQANGASNPNPVRVDAHTAWDVLAGADPSAFRLPREFRCAAYNRKLSDPSLDWQSASGRVHNDHYGYCYNQYVMVGNGKPEAAYTTGEEQHKGRDPRLIVTGYAPPNDPANTLVLFCSRWGVWQSKIGTLASDLSGTVSGNTTFSQYPSFPATPNGGAGSFCGVAAGVHDGRDNFLFLDGHVELLDRGNPADRRRMNKTWWRPLPVDSSFGHFAWNGAADYHVAYWFDDSGRPAGHLGTDGRNLNWWPSPPPGDYDWDS
jgi:prepilin-type processing-associated H-X9-DG protein